MKNGPFGPFYVRRRARGNAQVLAGATATYVPRMSLLGALRWSGAVAASSCLLVGSVGSSGARAGPSFDVVNASGTAPAATPEAVASVVLAQLGADARIDAITVVASQAAVSSAESNAALGPEEGLPVGGPVWVVRAHGRFVGRHTPPGVSDILSETGYVVVDDATLSIRAVGMPGRV